MPAHDHLWIEIACDRASTRAASASSLEALAAALQREFPTASLAPREPMGPVALSLRAWRAPSYDPQALDAQLATAADRGALRLSVLLDDDEPDAALVEILTRAQPYLDRRNVVSRSAVFDRALAAHRALHDLTKPLVRADYAHALDAWQWTLRLDPEASLAVQLAALFHDVERLASEADTRVEQHADDYVAFKRAHARTGASMARRTLVSVGLPTHVLDRTALLVGNHETPGADRERALLNDADALSFFSLNSAGFVDYYGAEHARKKIAYTLERASAAARARLSTIRLRADVAALVSDACTARGWA